MLLHEPVLYKKLDDQFHNVLHEKFGVGVDAEHLASYRLTKDHVTFHSTMYPRRGNSCSYLNLSYLPFAWKGGLWQSCVLYFLSKYSFRVTTEIQHYRFKCMPKGFPCYKMLFYEKLSGEIFWGKILWKFRKQTFQLLLTVMLL